MSGGSFDYMHSKSAQEILDSPDLLHPMAEELEAHGLPRGAAEIKGLILDMDGLRLRINHLRPLLKAIEWKASGDWGEAQLVDAYAQWVKARGEELGDG